MQKNKILKLICIITIVFVLIDQVSKIVVQTYCQEPKKLGIIEIIMVENTGMAFGFNSGNTKNIILTSLILLFILNFIRNQKDRIDAKTGVAISLILAGGIGNLIDRITRGGIMDFIKIKNLPIFNLADCYIILGWILLVIFLIQYNQKITEVENCEKQ